MKNSELNLQEVRQRILQTASDLFYQQGVRAVGVDLIVEKAEVAKTSLYRHFRTKDDLVAAFLEREDKDFWGIWDKVARMHVGDPKGELSLTSIGLASVSIAQPIVAVPKSMLQLNLLKSSILPAK